MQLKWNADELFGQIGQTPLVNIAHDHKKNGIIVAKLEFQNPSGSLKDRSVANMLLHALKENKLQNNRQVLDSSSGNAGISYATLCAALGLAVTLVVPGNASKERLLQIKALGATLIETDPLKGYDAAIIKAQQLAKKQPKKYWYANQYANPYNWQAHYEGTGDELIQQCKERFGRVPDAFVTGIGTGGSITGIARALKAVNPDIHILGVVPEIFPGIDGLKSIHNPKDIIPEILDLTVVDNTLTVTIEQAVKTAQDLAKEGLFVGPSSGANVFAAKTLLDKYELIATLLCDSGERYISSGLWS